MWVGPRVQQHAWYVTVIKPFYHIHQRLNILSAGMLCEHSSQQPLVNVTLLCVADA